MAILYYVIYPSAGAAPSVAQVKLGQDAAGSAAIASGNETSRTTTGAQTFATPASGLTASTSYRLAFVWSDGVDDSTVSVSDAWSTLSAAVNLVVSDGASVVVSDQAILTYNTTLLAADGSHSHTAEGVTLQATGESTLIVQEATHAHTAELVGMSIGLGLIVNDATHAHDTSGITVLRPDGDLAVGTWLTSTGGSLTSVLDAGDEDYIYSTSGWSGARVSLPPVADPGILTEHVLRYRAWRGTGLNDVQVILRHGTTEIINTVATLTETPTEFVYPITLTQGQADLIDYSNLEIMFFPNNANPAYFSEVSLSIDQTPELMLASGLVVADSDHAHAADQAVFEVAGSVNLEVQNAGHPHNAESVILTSVTGLATNDASHTQATDNVVLTSTRLLVVANASHVSSSSHEVFSRPTSDIVATGFASATGGPLYAAIDEVVADDADYIYNTDNTFVWRRIGLGAIPDPGVNTGHHLNFRAWNGGSLSYLFLYLHQGETLIASAIQELTSTTPQNFSLALTEAEAALITDYSALEFRTLVTAGTANVSQASVSVDKSVDLTAASSLVAADASHSHTANVPVISRPISDMGITGFGFSAGTAAFSLLDEAAEDDTDYIYSSSASDEALIKLGPMTDPNISTGHRVCTRAWAPGGTGSLFMYLYTNGGATLIKAQLITLTATPKTFIGTLTTGQADTIYDYNDLYVYYAPNTSAQINISQAYFEVGDDPALSSQSSLTSADAAHTHTAENALFTTADYLAIADAASAHASDSPILSLTGMLSLLIANASHAQTADSPPLTSATVLAALAATHAHTADSFALTSSQLLTVANAANSHMADGVILTSAHVLAVADAISTQAADIAALMATSALAVNSALSSHTAQEVALAVTEQFTLQILEAIHAQTAEGDLQLSNATTLAILDALHLHTGTSVSLLERILANVLKIYAENRTTAIEAEIRSAKTENETRTLS